MPRTVFGELTVLRAISDTSAVERTSVQMELHFSRVAPNRRSRKLPIMSPHQAAEL